MRYKQWMGPLSERVRPHLLPLCAVLGSAAVLALHGLGTRDIWLDEATTFHRAGLPIGALIDESIRKRHIPTYFLFMHHWIAFGDSEFMLRLPSALFGIAAVALTYANGVLLGGRRTGVIAGMLLALSPLHIRYCQEARMYTMVTCAAALAMLGLLWLVRHPAAAARPLADHDGRRRRLAAWGALTTGTLAALYLHNTGLFVAATMAAAALAALALSPGYRLGLMRGGLFAVVVTGACYAPWIPKLLGQTQDLTGRAWGRITPSYVQQVLGQLYLMEPRMGPLSVAMIVAAAAGAWSLRRRRRPLSVLVVVWIVGPALFIGVSLLYKTMFGPRLLLWTAQPITLLIALGVASIRPPQACVAAAVGLLVWIASANASRYYPEADVPWRTIATQLRDAQAHEDAAVIVVGLPARPLRYYFERDSDPVGPVQYTVGPRKLRRISRWMPGKVAKHHTVWMVLRHDRDGFHAREAIRWLDARGNRFHSERHGRARVYGYRMH